MKNIFKLLIIILLVSSNINAQFRKVGGTNAQVLLADGTVGVGGSDSGDLIESTFDNGFSHVGSPNAILNVGTWDANIREIGNVLRISDTQLVLTYTGTLLPYTEGVNEYIGLATSNDDGLTWVKGGPLNDGKIITTNSEDPFLLKNPVNGLYHLYSEKKMATGSKHDGVQLHTSVDLITWTDLGIVLQRDLASTFENGDVSSPTLLIDNGTWNLFYEARNLTGALNSGIVCLATSTDGITFTKNGSNPLVYGRQWNATTPIVTWGTHLVPDDIFKVGNYYYMNAHAWNGTVFAGAVLKSKDLLTWSDNLNTWMTRFDNSERLGDGLSVFYSDNKLTGLINTSTQLFTTSLTHSPYSKSIYTSRVTATGISSLIAGNKNEIIDANITTNTVFELSKNYIPTSGVSKIIKNNSAFTLSILPDTGVTINGSSVAVIVPANESIQLTNTGIDSWSISNSASFVADQINNGTTTIAPSQNAVFDALTLKAGFGYNLFTGDQEITGAANFKTNGTYILSSGDTGFTAPYSAYFHIKNPGYWESNVPIFAPTATVGTNTTQLATTAFVLANAGSGGGGDMVLASAQTVTGEKTFLDATLGLRNVANTFTSYFTNTNTASRTYTLPDVSGTIALIGDLNTLEFSSIDKTVWNNGKNNLNGNTSFGEYATASITTGQYNTGIGSGALRLSSTGGGNTSLGNDALGRNTTGSNNVAIGAGAGDYISDTVTGNSTGSNSTYLGYSTKPLNAGETNQIVIGYNTIGAGSNTVTLGNSSITSTILRGAVSTTSTIKNNNIIVDGNTIEEYKTNSDTGELGFNYRGYLGGTTKFRNFNIYDGKNTKIFGVTGSTGVVNIPNLVGTGTRTVVADASGNLSATQSFASGTYTPTLTNTTNISSSVLNQATYTQLGNIVTVTIGFQVTFTATGASTVLNVTLPISTTDTTQNGIGNGNVTTGGGATNAYGIVNINNGTSANFILYPLTNASSAIGSLMFQYSVN